jgi:hypothetical protein
VVVVQVMEQVQALALVLGADAGSDQVQSLAFEQVLAVALEQEQALASGLVLVSVFRVLALEQVWLWNRYRGWLWGLLWRRYKRLVWGGCCCCFGTLDDF